MDINWDEAPEEAIGAFTRGHETFFAKTKESSEYMNKPGYSGIQCDGDEYHVFTEYWVWSERPVAWSGEGLPPIGEVCEVKSTARGKERDWFKAQVKYISLFTVVLDDFPTGELEGEFVVHPDTVQFRPIKTKEQLAAEERKEAVDMMRWICEEWVDSDLDRAWSWDEIFGVLHDSGYRKQENNDAKA